MVTKLDVLSGLDRIQVCTSYRGAEGAEFDDFPYHQTVLHHTTAELTELRGLEGGPRRVPHVLRPARGRARVPGVHRRARRRPVTLVGVGPGREQVIWTDAGQETLLAPGGAATVER